MRVWHLQSRGPTATAPDHQLVHSDRRPRGPPPPPFTRRADIPIVNPSRGTRAFSFRVDRGWGGWPPAAHGQSARWRWCVVVRVNQIMADLDNLLRSACPRIWADSLFEPVDGPPSFDSRVVTLPLGPMGEGRVMRIPRKGSGWVQGFESAVNAPPPSWKRFTTRLQTRPNGARAGLPGRRGRASVRRLCYAALSVLNDRLNSQS